MTPDGVPPTLERHYSDEQLLLIFKAMLEVHHRRISQLQIQQEHDAHLYSGYGESVMSNQDRLMNRLVADLVYTDLGVPAHDDEALRWIERVLHEAKD